MPRYKTRRAIRVSQTDDGLEAYLDNSTGAERVRKFLRIVKHPKGFKAGEPFILAPWQDEEIITPLYDTRRLDGTRRYRHGYLSFARKSGKSTLAAGLANFHLFADGEYGAEVYAAASSREQAGLIFDIAASMVESSPLLRARATISRFNKTIRDKATNSVLKALSADVPHLHGLNGSFVVADEIAQQPNRDLYDVLVTSMGARRQPLMLSIGTAGWDIHSIAHELYAHSLQVLSGSVEDPAFFACVKELPKGADWTDEALWPLANPGLDDFRDREELRQACERAKQVPSQQNTYRNLYCNQWVSSETRWIDLGVWNEAPPLPVEPLDGSVCYVALDMSSTRDLTCINAVFPQPDGTFAMLLYSFLPGENLRDRVRRDRVPYDKWAEDGLIELTDGPTISYAAVENKLRELKRKYKVKRVIYDDWNAKQLAQRMEAEGFEMIEFPQKLRHFAEPTRAFEMAVLQRRIRHGGNDLLSWMVDCCTVKPDQNGYIRPIKPDRLRDSRRIDGVVAGIMALGSAILAPPAPKPARITIL